jgi:uncharacterized RDD family membrane protein YckC
VTPAPLATRLAALAYEALLLVALFLVAGFAIAPIVTRAPEAGRLALPGIGDRVLIFCAQFAVAALYFTWSWTGGRRTLPMKTWHLRIVDAAGARLDRKRALARYLAAWIGPALALGAYLLLRPAGLSAHGLWLFALNFVWAAVDPDRQFLHDRLAGTRIVRDA